MRWRNLQRSRNIEDRRGQSFSGGGGGGIAGLLIRFLPFLIKNKYGRIILLVGGVIFGAGHFLGINVLGFLTPGQSPNAASSSAQLSPEQQQLADFTSAVLGDTERTWNAVFSELGKRYKEPKLVLFTNRVNSACGSASAAMGPFYCPADQKAYIDLSFYEDLRSRYGAPGDFAQAYVIAHEIGHHVQNLLGTSGKVHQLKQKVSKTQANQLSVRLELQADCYAGLWGHYAHNTRNLLDSGDLQEAITAAAAIGDDRLQQQSRGKVVPDSFTHGSSAQRMRWFKIGFENGKLTDCNTFAEGVQL